MEKIACLDSHTPGITSKRYLFNGRFLLAETTFRTNQIQNGAVIFLLPQEVADNKNLVENITKTTNSDSFLRKVRIIADSKLTREISRICDLKKMRCTKKFWSSSSSSYFNRKQLSYLSTNEPKNDSINITTIDSLDAKILSVEPPDEPLPVCF